MRAGKKAAGTRADTPPGIYSGNSGGGFPRKIWPNASGGNAVRNSILFILISPGLPMEEVEEEDKEIREK